MLAAVIAALAVISSVQPAAAADRPCWKDVFSDWSTNGSVRRLYAVRCYTEALSHLPDDVRIYSTAEDDIKRARLDAIRARELPSRRSGVLGARAERSQPRARSSSAPSEETRALQDSTRGRSVVAPTPAASGVRATSPPIALVIGGAFAALLLAAAGIRTLQVRLLARLGRQPPPS